MTNTDQLREAIRSLSKTIWPTSPTNYPDQWKIDINELTEFIEQHTATAVRAASFPYAETYDFLYNNHKDVLEELEEHLDALKKEGSNE